MNFPRILNRLGLLLAILSVVFLAIGLLSLVLHRSGNALEEHAWWTLLVTSGSSLLLGALLWLPTRRETRRLVRKDALLMVSMSWILGAAIAAMPYYLWAVAHHDEPASHPFGSFLNCYFEAMSGLTTTGASILTNVQDIPDSLMLWRATTNWIGGLGIVLFFVAVLPDFGLGSKRLIQAEAVVHTSQGVRPQVRHTARVLWIVYVVITVFGILTLRISGLPWFDATCSSFAAIATGGFGTENANIGAYDSVGADIIIIVLMVLGGMNFGIYYQIATGRHQQVWKNSELHTYAILLVAGSAIAALGLWGFQITTTTGRLPEPGVGSALQYGVFNVVSMGTDTGFATCDFDLWPFLSKAVLIGMVFVGGCAGSTTGGIKMVRVLVAFKVVAAQVHHAFRPAVVKPVSVGNRNLDQPEQLDALVFIVIFAVILLVGACGLMLLEPAGTIDFKTASTASLATLCTAGPGLGAVGPMSNYEWLSDSSTVLLCLLMVMGRLEVFTILVLFSPSFWRTD